MKCEKTPLTILDIIIKITHEYNLIIFIEHIISKQMMFKHV